MAKESTLQLYDQLTAWQLIEGWAEERGISDLRKIAAPLTQALLNRTLPGWAFYSYSKDPVPFQLAYCPEAADLYLTRGFQDKSLIEIEHIFPKHYLTAEFLALVAAARGGDPERSTLSKILVNRNEFRVWCEQTGTDQPVFWLGGEAPQPRRQAPSPDAAKPANRIYKTGDHWTITYEGQTRTLNNTMGLRYIAWLIRNQGKEVLVSKLYYAINPPDREAIDSTHSAMTAKQLDDVGPSVGDLGNAGDVLTPEGAKRLRQHIDRIQEQLEDAIERGENERQLVLEDEQEKLLAHVAAGTGLEGRTRKASSSIEKIRTSVTKRIHGDIKEKITPALPELGRHLDAFLDTGTQCIYKPDPPVNWIFDAN